MVVTSEVQYHKVKFFNTQHGCPGSSLVYNGDQWLCFSIVEDIHCDNVWRPRWLMSLQQHVAVIYQRHFLSIGHGVSDNFLASNFDTSVPVWYLLSSRKNLAKNSWTAKCTVFPLDCVNSIVSPNHNTFCSAIYIINKMFNIINAEDMGFII